MKIREGERGRPTLAETIEEYLLFLRSRYQPKTAERARYCLSKLIAYAETLRIRTVKQLHARDIRLLILQLREAQYSAETVWAIGSTIRAFLRWCVQEGYLEESPLKEGDIPAKPKPKPQPLTEEELHRILNACTEQGWIGDRNYAIIITLVYTGLRRGELTRMRYEDLQKGFLLVQGKGDTQRVVHLSDVVVASIRKYLQSLKKQRGVVLEPEDPLWWDRNLRPLTDDNVRRTLDRIGERAGVHLYAHRLRDTCATMRLARGAPTEAVRTLLGHRDVRSIQAYAKLADSDLRRIMEETDPLRGVSPYRKRPNPPKRKRNRTDEDENGLV